MTVTSSRCNCNQVFAWSMFVSYTNCLLTSCPKLLKQTKHTTSLYYVTYTSSTSFFFSGTFRLFWLAIVVRHPRPLTLDMELPLFFYWEDVHRTRKSHRLHWAALLPTGTVVHHSFWRACQYCCFRGQSDRVNDMQEYRCCCKSLKINMAYKETGVPVFRNNSHELFVSTSARTLMAAVVSFWTVSRCWCWFPFIPHLRLALASPSFTKPLNISLVLFCT